MGRLGLSLDLVTGEVTNLTEGQPAFAAILASDLSARGVRALLLGRPGADGLSPSRAPEDPSGLELLVPRDAASRARTVLESYDWRYQLGNLGPWRILPLAMYLWDGMSVHLYWGIPAAPLPSVAFVSLERTLWQGASAGSLGFAEPDPEPLAVFLALQASRDRYRREERLRHLSNCLSVASWERAEQIADRCGIGATLRWAAGAARRATVDEESEDRTSAPPPDTTTLKAIWSVGQYFARHAYPRRLRLLISGTPRLGGVVGRCRFAGVEVLVGPGIFVPEMTSERLVKASLDCLAHRRNPILVETGTGCGAIALAIAAGHPSVRVHAVEKFGPPLMWAKRNRRRLGQTRVRLYRGSLLDSLPGDLAGRVAVIVANLPYVPVAVWADQGRLAKVAVRGESDDGLGLYRRLIHQARRFLEPGGRLVLEMGPYQVDAFRADVSSLGYAVERVERPVGGAVVVTARLSA